MSASEKAVLGVQRRCCCLGQEALPLSSGGGWRALCKAEATRLRGNETSEEQALL